MKKIIKKIRQFFAGRHLKRDLVNRRIKRETVSYEEAKKVGLIFTAHSEKDIQSSLEYIELLKNDGKQVEFIGYIDIKDYHKTHKNESINPHFIFAKDFDFFHRPKKSLIEKFYKEPFDLLISLNYTNEFSMNYISSLSSARLRIGKFNSNAMNAFDFMIDDKGETLETYIEQLKHYIHKLKK